MGQLRAGTSQGAGAASATGPEQGHSWYDRSEEKEWLPGAEGAHGVAEHLLSV